jgi:hypothetical protein
VGAGTGLCLLYYRDTLLFDPVACKRYLLEKSKMAE